MFGEQSDSLIENLGKRLDNMLAERSYERFGEKWMKGSVRG
jgi:hypothetical protein